MSSPGWTARLLILVTAVLFSTGGAAIKATTLDGWQVAGFRSGIAALTVFLILPEARRRWSPRILFIAVIYAVTLILFVQSNKLTTAASSIYLQSTAPLYTLLLSPWLLGEPIRRRDLLFMVALAVGLGLFFAGGEPSSASAPDPALGNLLAVATGVCWSLTVIGLRSLGRSSSADSGGAATAVVAGNTLAFVFCLPFALPVESAGLQDGTVILFLGVFQIGVAYAFLTRGLRDVPALEASLLLLVEPILSPIWAWLLHKEVPGRWSLAGCTIIMIATAAKTWADARRFRAARPRGK